MRERLAGRRSLHAHEERQSGAAALLVNTARWQAMETLAFAHAHRHFSQTFNSVRVATT